MLLPLNVVYALERAYSPWNGHDHTDTLRQSVKLEAVIGAELVLQARACGRDADPLLQGGQRVLREAHSVVPHFDPELVVIPARGDVDVTRPRFTRDTVFDRVLDERLQQQRRHQRVERLGLDLVPDHEAVGKTCSFDLQVLAEEVELGAERDFLFAEPLEREPQQVAQTHERPIGGVHVAVHQRRNGVQRVEQKVRMQLLVKGLELCLHEPGFQM